MYVDLAGLARYRQDFDAWARGRLLPKDAAAARVRTAKAGAVSFVPVQETPLDVSVDFLFAETPPASGNKSPSNPSTITGVSSVKTVRCGKNLFAFPKNYSRTLSNGVTISVDSNGFITLNGTATANGYDVVVLTAPLVVTPGISITISNTFISGTQTLNQDDLSFKTQLQLKTVPASSSYWVAASKFETATYAMTIERYVSTCQIYIYSGSVFNNLKFKTQAEFGVASTDFEPYSGDTYTISLGNTYYGGSIDLATGVMTVTWKGITFTGTEEWDVMPDINGYHPYYPVSSNPPVDFGRDTAGDYPKCTHANFTTAYGTNINPSQFGMWGTAGRIIMFSDKSMADWKAWLASQYANGTPVKVSWFTSAPFTVQLSPTEILSLTQSSVYDPRLNTVYSDAQAVQVGYLKHPSAASSDFRNAIVSLGGGV